MTYPFPPDVAELIKQQMDSGSYRSEDDVLRAALQTLAGEAEDLQAIRAAIAEMEAGDPGTPLEEAFARVRTQTSLDP